MADIFNMADTWNAGGTTFTAIKMNVTDTASAAASLLMDLLVGGTSKFKVNKAGGIVSGLNTFGTSNATIFGATVGINFFNAAAYFQTSSSVGVSIGVSGSAGNIMVSSNGQYAFSSTSPGASGADVAINRNAADVLEINNGTAAAYRDLKLRNTITTDTAFMCKTAGTLADGAAAQVGTITNAPTAGNPTKWIAINDNGTTRYVPAW